MKKLIWMAAFVAATFCGNTTFAGTPSQDKPASKTTTTVKKTTPAKATAKATKSTHSKHVKKAG